MAQKTKKKEPWIRPRHQVVRNIAHLLLYPVERLVYGAEITPFRQKGQYLILMNHQTAFDQFFIGSIFPQHVYYIASEDLFSKGLVSSFIRWAVNPIPITKQSTDITAVMNCIKVAREGGSIALAPEGNRTFDGKPVHINPAIGGLVKKLNLPVAVVHIEGGYGVQPRWSDVIRRGKMRAYVSQVIPAQELRSKTKEEVYELICSVLDIREDQNTGEFKHRKNAEFLERALYVCPHCGFAHLESHKDLITCRDCGLTVRHKATKELEGVGSPFPFPFVGPWYDYQCDFVRHMEMDPSKCLFEDRVTFIHVVLLKRRECLGKKVPARLYCDRMEIDGRTFSFEELTGATVVGRNKLNFYTGGEIYQLQGEKRFNALKYVNFYFNYKNRKEGKPDDYLGL